MGSRVDVNQNAVGREPLGAVRRDSIAVIEVPHLVGVETDLFAVVHLHGELSVFADMLHRAEVAVGNA